MSLVTAAWFSTFFVLVTGCSETMEIAEGEATKRCGDNSGSAVALGFGNSRERSILGGRILRFESFMEPFGCLRLEPDSALCCDSDLLSTAGPKSDVATPMPEIALADESRELK